jgi:glycosyltransferase involved in cell wall biosynthesis
MSAVVREVSVVMPFVDDEEVIGSAARAVAKLLLELGVDFELLAVDEDSGDNSHAVLALMRAEVPQLRVVHAPARGRGLDAASSKATGRILLIVNPSAAMQLDGLELALNAVRTGSCEAYVALNRFTVVERVRASVAMRGLKALGDNMHKRLLRRLQLVRLNVLVTGGSSGNTQKVRRFALGGFSRW